MVCKPGQRLENHERYLRASAVVVHQIALCVNFHSHSVYSLQSRGEIISSVTRGDNFIFAKNYPVNLYLRKIERLKAMNDMICCGNDLFAEKKYQDAEMK